MYIPEWIINGTGRIGLKTVRGWLMLSKREEQDARIRDLEHKLEAANAKIAEYESFERLKEQFTYSEEVGCWHKDGTGPYCLACLDLDHRPIRLIPIGDNLYDCAKHTNLRFALGRRRTSGHLFPRLLQRRHHPRKKRY